MKKVTRLVYGCTNLCRFLFQQKLETSVIFSSVSEMSCIDIVPDCHNINFCLFA